MNLKIETNELVEPGTIYFIPEKLLCRECHYRFTPKQISQLQWHAVYCRNNHRNQFTDHTKKFGLIKLDNG